MENWCKKFSLIIVMGKKEVERGEALATKREPIVEEPDDFRRDINDNFGRSLIGNDFFGRIFGDVFFRDFGNLENSGGYSEVKTYSSYMEYKDGKVVKNEERGEHYLSDNGKGFYRTMRRMPDGNVVKEERSLDSVRRIGN